jgi:hypothetical protein
MQELVVVLVSTSDMLWIDGFLTTRASPNGRVAFDTASVHRVFMTELIAAAVKELISQDMLRVKAFERTGCLLRLHTDDVENAKQVKPQGVLKLPYKIPACYQSHSNRGSSSSASNALSNASGVAPASSSIEENSNGDISPADTAITELVVDESSDTHVCCGNSNNP